MRPRPRHIVWLAVGLALLVPEAAAAKDVHLRGTAYEFNRVETTLAGATVRVVERPALKAVVRADGTYDLRVPDRARITPYVEAAGYHTIHLQTFTTAGEDLRDVNFQVPTDAVYRGLVALLHVPTDAAGNPTACAIVSTFSTRDVRGVDYPTFIAYGAHGVAGATATASPPLPPPTYFNEGVLPDPMQPFSSKDGGVVWTGVPAGTYVIRGTAATTRFASFRATCVPGRVVNANPPWGLHELGLANPARIAAHWRLAGGSARLRRLTVTSLPPEATVRLRCTGRGCAFRSRTVRLAPGAVSANLRASTPVRQRRLRPGQALEVRVTARGYDGAVKRWRARRGRMPLRSVRCVPLGGTRDRGC